MRVDAGDDALERGEAADERRAVVVDLQRSLIRRRLSPDCDGFEQPGQVRLVGPLLVVSMHGQVAPLARVADDRFVVPGPEISDAICEVAGRRGVWPTEDA